MDTWEIEVDVRVRKTLVFSGPQTEEAARMIVKSLLTPGGLPIATVQKCEYRHGKPEPVETIIGNDPQIVSVTRVS